jgi:hypothetical protein
LLIIYIIYVDYALLLRIFFVNLYYILLAHHVVRQG